jgi:folate-dependent tRNA-U54 methylase TrmFO/GidA
MVCSNSFRSDDDERNAVGLLHWEMRAAGLVMEMAAAATAAGRRRPGRRPRSLRRAVTAACARIR